MKQINGCFNLNTSEYTDFSENIYTYSAQNVSLYICGRAETDDTVNDGDSIIGLYREFGMKLTEHISGVYIAVIVDNSDKKLFVFHDRTTSSLTLYYTEIEGELYLSTSLKKLIVNSKLKAEFDDSHIGEFLTNGFIYGENTLVKDVFKLKAFHCLGVTDSKVKQHPVKYALAEMPENEALKNFKPVLDEAIKKSLDGVNDISMPLSSGYDSNYICHILTEKTDKKITAFSIGGKHGKNEVPVIVKNAEYYRNLSLETALTDSSTLKNLPDIVWRLEGSVYECGVFLQYELARLVNSMGKHILICGECADQVMNITYYSDERINVNTDGASDKPVYYDFSEYAYIFGSFLILKKNGILSNSFDVETRYPYLDGEFVAVCEALKEVNGKGKPVHAENCNRCLPREVVDNMAKIGGSTDCRSMFDSEAQIKRFISDVKKTSFYREYKDVIRACSVTEKEKQTGITALKTGVRNAVLTVSGKRNNGGYFEEMLLREYLCVAYLSLFRELMTSGKYDLSQSKCPVTFDDIKKIRGI